MIDWKNLEANDLILSPDRVSAYTIGPGLVQDLSPIEYRLAKKNGTLILQAKFSWQRGSEYGYEWKDIPTINLDRPYQD